MNSIPVLFLIPIFGKSHELDLKEMVYSVRTDENNTIESAHIYWTDSFDDSFSLAYTDQNKSNFKFLHEKPHPELRIVSNYTTVSFSHFLEMYLNSTEIDLMTIIVPKLSEEMLKIFDDYEESRAPKIREFRFNTYDSRLYFKFLRLSSGIPQHIELSFFSYSEIYQNVIDSAVFDNYKIRKTSNLNIEKVESMISDNQLFRLECKYINLQSSSISNQGINRILKDWQAGKRNIKYLKVATDDLQRAEVMNGIRKRTISRSMWEIKNRFNISATTSLSRITTTLFGAKPTFEFIV